jgi:hypothetical protein
MKAATLILVMCAGFVMFSLDSGEVSAGAMFSPPTDDASIYHDSPDFNAGGHHTVWVRNEYGGGGSGGWETSPLVKFDLSCVLAASVIESATLYLYYYYWDDNNPTGRALTCYRLTEDWDESTVTWNTRPAAAPTPTSSSVVPGAYGWIVFDVTSDVQAFADGQADNYGWRIRDENYWGSTNIPITHFYSKEYGSFVPYLDVVVEGGDPSSIEQMSWGRIRAMFR